MKKLEKIYRDIQPKIYAFFYVKTSSQANKYLVRCFFMFRMFA